MRRGFTLIELLVVISIIGILAALLIANMVGVRERARDAATKNNLKQLQSALRLYYNDYQTYPAAASGTPCSTLISGTLSVGATPYTQPLVIDTPGSCTYTSLNGGEGYRIVVDLFSGAGTDDTNSGTQCGVTPEEKKYFVCAM